MESAAPAWADFSVARLLAFCRLRAYCDCYADAMTRRFLEHAIFSVYLDCRQADLSQRAREILTEWLPEAIEVPAPTGSHSS